jgi:hypothetical protein
MSRKAFRWSLLLAAVVCPLLGTPWAQSFQFSGYPGPSSYFEYYDMASQGLSTCPVPMSYDYSNWQQVGFGSYIVNAMGVCYTCHSNQQINPVNGSYPVPRGYMAGQCFGSSCSRNLTPDSSGQPGGYDLYSFIAAVRTVPMPFPTTCPSYCNSTPLGFQDADGGLVLERGQTGWVTYGWAPFGVTVYLGKGYYYAPFNNGYQCSLCSGSVWGGTADLSYLTDSDLTAVYYFLKSIPSASPR